MATHAFISQTSNDSFVRKFPQSAHDWAPPKFFSQTLRVRLRESGIYMDRTGFRMQNAFMGRSMLIPLLVLSANFLVAQQPEPTSPKSKTIGLPAGTRPPDPATVATGIRDSYYHPDEISGLNCNLSVDWPAIFSAMKVNPAPDRLKVIQNLNIRSHSVRGNSPDITFDCASGALNNKEQIEDGLKQTLGGFYQMY